MSQLDGFTTHVRDLMNRINFIGKTPPSMKVSISRKLYLDPNDFWTAPGRWMRSESSRETCDYIDKIIESLFEILSEHSDPNSNVKKTLINHALILRPGIINLTETYSYNPSAFSRLRTSLSILDVRLRDNKVEINDDEPEAI